MSERPDPFDLFATETEDPRLQDTSGATEKDALELFASESTSAGSNTVGQQKVERRQAVEPGRPPPVLHTVPERDDAVAAGPHREWAAAPGKGRRWLVLPAAALGITALAVSLWMYREGPDLPGLDEVRSERSVAPLPRPMPAAAPEVLDDGPGIEADSPVPTGPAAPVVLEREDESEPADDTLRAPAPGERASPVPAAPETASNGRRPESAAVPATQPARLEPAAGLRLSTLSELSGPTPAVAPALSAPSAVPAPPDAPESGAAGNRPGEPDRSQPVPEMDLDLRARQAIARTVDRYRAALTQLDSQMARSVWPSVDAGALDRAFSQLERQRVEFDHCEISHGAGRATAFCSGRAEYVPRVGNSSPRTDYRTWTISLRQNGDQWLIQQVASQ